MTSQIDPDVIVDDQKVDKADLREQFGIARDEITALQRGTSRVNLTAFGIDLLDESRRVDVPITNDDLATMPAFTWKGNNTSGIIKPKDLTAAEMMLALGITPIGRLIGANMDSTADQAIVLTLPSGFTKMVLNRITVMNASISLTTAVGGIYTAAAKGGIAMGNSAQSYAVLTATGPNVNGCLLNMGIASTWYVPGSFSTPNTVFLSLTTPQGAAATADFYVFGLLIP